MRKITTHPSSSAVRDECAPRIRRRAQSATNAHHASVVERSPRRMRTTHPSSSAVRDECAPRIRRRAQSATNAHHASVVERSPRRMRTTHPSSSAVRDECAPRIRRRAQSATNAHKRTEREAIEAERTSFARVPDGGGRLSRRFDAKPSHSPPRAGGVQVESPPAPLCSAHPSRTALDDGCVLILRMILSRKVCNFTGSCAKPAADGEHASCRAAHGDMGSVTSRGRRCRRQPAGCCRGRALPLR